VYLSILGYAAVTSCRMAEGNIEVDLQFGMPEVTGENAPSHCCQEHFDIVQMLQQERSAAEDRERRLLVRVDRLTKLVETLTQAVVSLELSSHSQPPLVASPSIVKLKSNKSSLVFL